MKTSSIKSRFASVLLIITVIFTMSFAAAPAAFAADQLDAADQTLIVDAKAPVTVKTRFFPLFRQKGFTITKRKKPEDRQLI